METGKQGQGSGYGGSTGQQAGMTKGLDSFRDNPQLAQQVVREGYIQQAGNTGDVEAIRQGSWDNKIPGFELATHILQNAPDLVGKVPQTS